MKTIDELHRLERELAGNQILRASEEWGGAYVIITKRRPPKSRGSFRPDARYVVTKYSLELSWVFECLRDAFYAEKRVDGASKFEFFGRLANAANRYLQRSDNPTARCLCAAVLHEAFAIYEEMETGEFRYFAVAIGNEIVDDYVDEALRTGFIGIEDTLDFFMSHGVEVGRD